MKTAELKVTRIGNSRGVRLPAASLQRFHIGAVVLMEERSEGLLLRPAGSVTDRLSWEETARAMAACCEDWSDLAQVDADGLDSIAWEPGNSPRVAEACPAPHRAGRRNVKRS